MTAAQRGFTIKLADGTCALFDIDMQQVTDVWVQGELPPVSSWGMSIDPKNDVFDSAEMAIRKAAAPPRPGDDKRVMSHGADPFPWSGHKRQKKARAAFLGAAHAPRIR